ncbi:E3 ubiquitin-protein ligase SHPRH, partial [Armadillidium nasatum]
PNCSTNFKSKHKSIPSFNSKNVQERKKRKKDNEIDYGSFNNVLENCEINVKVDTKSSEFLIHCLFGKISLNILNFDVNFEVNDNFWVYVSKECDQSAIYFEWYENISESDSESISIKQKANNFRYFHLLGNLDTNLWFGLKRYCHLVLDKVENGVLYINVYLLKSALVKVNFSSEFHQGRKYLFSLCSHFYSIEPFEKEGEKNHKHDIDILYKFVKNFHSDKKYNHTNPQHPYLIPTLRPYQKQAVQWMLFQEQPKVQEELKSLHPLYVEIRSLDNVLLYYNRFGRYFVSEKPFEVLPCPGGILADEMGLGKTVEVLSCVMCHPRPNYSSPFRSLENENNEENSLTMKESFEANKLEPCSMIKEETNTSSEEEKGSCFSRRKKKTNMKIPRIVNYSQLDSVLDSDKGSKDSDYDLNLSEEEREDLEHESVIEEQKLSRRSKRKAQSVDYSEFIESDLETEFELRKGKRKSQKFKVEEEINSNPVLKLIDNVILNVCWDGLLANYKAKGALKSNGYTEFFETKIKQKSYFECVCGKKNDTNDSISKVQCTKCSLWQHAACVQFKLRGNNESKYICPHCWTTQPPVPSGATLIISPSSISHQWVEEIKKHVREKSLRVFVYKGVG